jgi:hypothetical protein
MVQAPPGPLPYAVRVPEPEQPDTTAPDDGLSSVRAVPYKGADLDAQKGPGLGCFRFQLVLLVVLLAATPLSVTAGAPDWLSAGLLFGTIALLLIVGQTIIFLLRLVAADRRGRRRPLASATPTIGELEDRDAAEDASAASAANAGGADDAGPGRRPADQGMRQ